MFAVFITGAILRFHALDRQSLWDDEMSTIHTMACPRAQLLNRFLTYEVHPPLYFLQMRTWFRFGGRSLVRMRANSALWGTLSLLLMFSLGTRYFGRSGGFVAMALLAFSPYHLAYSQEARPYALGVFLALLGLWLVEQIVGESHPFSRRSLALLALVWSCLLFTHYWGAFVFLAEAVYAYWKIASRSDAKEAYWAAAIPAVCFSLWLPVVWRQVHVTTELASFWVPPFAVSSLLKPFAAFSGLYFNVASYIFYLPTVLGIGVGFGIGWLIALAMGVVKGPLVAKLWLAALIIPWLLSAWRSTIYVWYRYPMFIFPSFILLVAAGIMNIKAPWARLALFGICIGSEIWGCAVYFGGWQKANPKAVVQYVHWLRTKETIVVRPAYFGDLFTFYDHGTSLAIDEDKLDSSEKRLALKGRDILLVAFDVPSDPISEAILREYKPISGRYFPGYAHLGVTVYRLK